MATAPTTLSSIARMFCAVLEEDYGLDGEQLMKDAGLDMNRINDPEGRYPREQVLALWDIALAATGDPTFALRAGFRVRPTTYHVLSCSWIASHTLAEALDRLQRYFRIISNAPIDLTIKESGSCYILEMNYPDPAYPVPHLALDSFFASVVQLCRTTSSEQFRPLKVWFQHEDFGQPEIYTELFRAPVRFGADINAIFFDKKTMDAPLPGGNPLLADIHDRVAERYLETLDPAKVASAVRRILLELMPTGHITQSDIAGRMNKSLSTLQRQLNREGITFQTIRDQTRQDLGEAYVRDNELPLNEIAYLLGFSDQSNFARAFKRWTGKTPGQFRSTVDI